MTAARVLVAALALAAAFTLGWATRTPTHAHGGILVHALRGCLGVPVHDERRCVRDFIRYRGVSDASVRP